MTKKQRNKQLDAIRAKLEELRDQLDTIKSEMEDDYNNKSERWQEGDKGQEAQDQIDKIQEFYETLDNAATDIEDFITE